MLAKDTSFVERLPDDQASMRSVVGEELARTVPTMETDVLPETPNMFTAAVLGTSVSKRVFDVSDRARQEVCSCGGPCIF